MLIMRNDKDNAHPRLMFNISESEEEGTVISVEMKAIRSSVRTASVTDL